LRANETELG